MESQSFTVLLWTAASIGVIHTVMGPDHYLPFVAMARARSWTWSKTAFIVLACGVGHVVGSVGLGGLGVAFGWTLGGLKAFESVRGSLAGWLMLGFGLAYTAWGLRRAVRNRPHRHLHAHADGTFHSHDHLHDGEHVHVHDVRGTSPASPPGRADRGRVAPTAAGRQVNITGWVLFTLFVFGPCEPLIPFLMVPAAQRSIWGLVWVTSVFAAATLATMLAAVALGLFGLGRIASPALERYAHALAGLVVTACGVAMKAGL